MMIRITLNVTDGYAQSVVEDTRSDDAQKKLVQYSS